MINKFSAICIKKEFFEIFFWKQKSAKLQKKILGDAPDTDSFFTRLIRDYESNSIHINNEFGPKDLS